MLGRFVVAFLYMVGDVSEKTSLVKYFLNKVRGIYINCSWLSNSMSFASIVKRFIARFNSNLANTFWGKVTTIDDSEHILYESLDALDSLSQITKKTLAIALDEFHIFIKNIAKKIARKNVKT